MNMRLQPKVSPKVNLNTVLLKIVLGTVAFSCIIFAIAFFINTLGVSTDSVAGKTTANYPFDVSSSSLKKVNFTILSTTINSSYDEVRPIISSEGNSIFFCRRNHPDNVVRKKDAQDIWYSTLQTDGQWADPKNVGDVINSPEADAICSVSPDGSEIIFFYEEIDPAKPLFKSQKTEMGWTSPQPIKIREYSNKSDFVDFHHSYNAKVLLMAIQQKGTRGEQDLYVSFPEGENEWSAPVNLGPVVNSFEADFAPFLAKDGRTLFFASYGHNGMGGCDIYQSVRLDDTWQRWSKPVNLGAGINSDREESYFSISNNYQHIYFESYDIHNQVRDIFRANLPEKVKPVEGGSKY